MAVPTITIVVHATLFFFLKLSFLKNLIYCPDGMNQADKLPKLLYFNRVAHALEEADPERFSVKTTYFYGWSGRLSYDDRLKAGAHLYKAINKLQEKYKKQYGVRVPVRVITHSHGGNVALNAVRAARSHKDSSFVIDELITFGCPVQQSTSYLAHDSRIKNMYAFYSTGDAMQILDPQGITQKSVQPNRKKVPLFSERVFKPAPHLKNVRVKINGKNLGHTAFMFPSTFIRLLPHALDKVQHQKHSHHHIVSLHLHTHKHPNL